MKKIVKSLIYIIFCRIFYRVEYVNKENEEKLQKCIICPNHSNTVEPGFIYAKTNNLNIMAKAELFKFKPIASLLYYFDVFPINRGKGDIKSLLHSINIFKTDKEVKLLIFPEGHRIPKNKERGEVKFGRVVWPVTEAHWVL
jgi:1-acyl-sn-glycerol-3-phosphate acyltransferase